MSSLEGIARPYTEVVHVGVLRVEELIHVRFN